MGTSNYNLPLIGGADSVKIPRDFNQLSTTLDNLLKQQFTSLSMGVETLTAQVVSARTEKIEVTRINDNSLPSQKLKVSSDSERIRLVNLSDEVLQAMAGNTSVNVTPTINSVTSEKMTNKSVVPEKTTFLTNSKNLFDLTRSTSGMRVNSSNGQLIAEVSGYPVTVSDFIVIEGGTQYALRYGGEAAFYDVNRVFISGVTRSTTFTTPANAVYVRHNTDTGNVSGQQLEKGSAFTTYEVYKLYADPLKLKITNMSDKIVAKEHIAFNVPELIPNKNLFDYRTATDGKYVDALSGNLANEVAPYYYWASDYIPVTAGQMYSIPSNQQLAWYNSAKQYISGSANLKTVTAPTGAAFLRVSVPEATLESFQVEKGSVSTSPSPFGYTIDALTIEDRQKNKIYLNQKSAVFVTSNGTYQLAWKRLLKNYNPNTMRVSVTAAPAGTKFKSEYIELNNVSAGSKTLTVRIEYTSGEEITTQNITIQSSDKTAKTSQQYLLMIGDSLTRELGFTGGVTSELTNVASVGIRSLNNDGVEVNEGRGGWKLEHYLTQFGVTTTVENPFLFPNGVTGDMYFGNTDSWKKICYTDPNNYEYKGFQLIAKDWNTLGSYQYDANGYRLNPPTGAVMYDPSKATGEKYQQYNGTSWGAMSPQPTGVSFDFGKYLERFKVAFGGGTKNPTVISIMLGTNDLQSIRKATGATMATLRGYLVTMFNSIKAWNPNVKVILCVPPLSSTQDRWGDARGIDLTKWEFDDNIHLFAEELSTNSTLYPMSYTVENFIGALWDESNDQGDWLHPTTQGKAKLAKFLAGAVQHVR